MKQAIVLVSFGTSHDEARERGIDRMARELQAQHPNWDVRQAYTSGMVRSILARRGIHIPSIEEAIEALLAQGAQDILLQPTLLLPGEEYEKLRRAASAKVRIGQPLLSTTQDMEEVVEAVAAHYPCAAGQALVLMGHGTPAATNTVYAALDYMCKQRGHAHIFLGTVEAYPGVEIVAQAVAKAGYVRALLAPLMLVAGDHAKNDMAGEQDDSWKQVLESHGVAAEVRLTGLGELPSIHAIYLRHIEEALQHDGL